MEEKKKDRRWFYADRHEVNVIYALFLPNAYRSDSSEGHICPPDIAEMWQLTNLLWTVIVSVVQMVLIALL